MLLSLYNPRPSKVRTGSQHSNTQQERAIDALFLFYSYKILE
jgi:hypothetical protein